MRGVEEGKREVTVGYHTVGRVRGGVRRRLWVRGERERVRKHEET